LPSEILQGSSRIQNENTYRFGDQADGGIIGTVTTAAVDENSREV
jgi:hypothetical protein